jgi:hypothetical protein
MWQVEQSPSPGLEAWDGVSGPGMSWAAPELPAAGERARAKVRIRDRPRPASGTIGVLLAINHTVPIYPI